MKKRWQIYLTALSVYLTSGVTSTPPSTTFEMRKTANTVAIASHTVVSANASPMYIGWTVGEPILSSDHVNIPGQILHVKGV